MRRTAVQNVYFEIVRKRIIIPGARCDNVFRRFFVAFYCLTFYPEQSLTRKFYKLTRIY